MYFKMTEDTLHELIQSSESGQEISNNSVRLWSEWCEKAVKDAAMRARFKALYTLFPLTYFIYVFCHYDR